MRIEKRRVSPRKIYTMSKNVCVRVCVCVCVCERERERERVELMIVKRTEMQKDTNQTEKMTYIRRRKGV